MRWRTVWRIPLSSEGNSKGVTRRSKKVGKKVGKKERKTYLGVRDVPKYAANEVLAFCTTRLDRFAFREFDKLGERDSGQRFFPCPLYLIFQPQLNGSCGRCNDDPRKNLQTVRVDNVQRVLK